MLRKIKFCVFFTMVISCVACSSANKTSSTENKTDLRKAALLNIELGQNYLEQGQVSRAKKKLIHALDLAPKLPEAHSSMGYFFETVGDNKQAEQHYRKAVSLGKGQGLFHNNYGVFLCGQGRYKEADKEFLIAANDYNYTKTAEVYENAGLCALKATDLAKAENYFKIAVRYDASQVASLMELAELRFKHADVAGAQEYLNKLRKQVDPTPRMLWLAIQIAQRNNDHDALASNSLLLKNLFPDSSEYKLYLELLDR